MTRLRHTVRQQIEEVSDLKTIRYAAACVQGNARRNNEDNLFCDGFYLPENNSGMEEIRTGQLTCSCSIVAVFDGMGGETAGETAAYLAARTLSEENNKTNTLAGRLAVRLHKSGTAADLCYAMNEAVCRYAGTNRIHSMGSTVAGLLIFGKQITGFNLGDSRIYHLSDAGFQQISQDHNERSVIRRKTPLTQFLGIPKSEMHIEPHYEKRRLQAGERYLLCTDGVTDVLEDSEIQEFLCNTSSPADTVRAMLDKIRACGYVDNTTLILLET